MCLSEHEGLVSVSYAIYEQGVDFIDQIYDALLAIACNVMREIWGSRWVPEKVYFARAMPADVGAYRRFFRAPCRFDSERTAILFPSYFLDKLCPKRMPNGRRLELRLSNSTRAVLACAELCAPCSLMVVFLGKKSPDSCFSIAALSGDCSVSKGQLFSGSWTKSVSSRRAICLSTRGFQLPR